MRKRPRTEPAHPTEGAGPAGAGSRELQQRGQGGPWRQDSDSCLPSTAFNLLSVFLSSFSATNRKPNPFFFLFLNFIYFFIQQVLISYLFYMY